MVCRLEKLCVYIKILLQKESYFKMNFISNESYFKAFNHPGTYPKRWRNCAS